MNRFMNCNTATTMYVSALIIICNKAEMRSTKRDQTPMSLRYEVWSTIDPKIGMLSAAKSDAPEGVG